MNNESERPRKVITIEVEFSEDELERIDAAATVLQLTRDGFLRHATAEYIRQRHIAQLRQTPEPPLSAGYAAALAEGRPPTMRDILDSYELSMNPPAEPITLSEEQSHDLRMFALVVGKTTAEVVREFINTAQLLGDGGVDEARFWWDKQPVEQRPSWARGDFSDSQREFSGVLAALSAFRALKQRTAPQNSAWQ